MISKNRVKDFVLNWVLFVGDGMDLVMCKREKILRHNTIIIDIWKRKTQSVCFFSPLLSSLRFISLLSFRSFSSVLLFRIIRIILKIIIDTIFMFLFAVYNLVNDIDIQKTREKIEKYKETHKELIEQRRGRKVSLLIHIHVSFIFHSLIYSIALLHSPFF
jgi:hypothetical protein